MASSPTNDPPLPPVTLDPIAGLLSYIIPGLGQIYQGRVGKGLLFFGGLYLLFFYGMWMGQWRNVWLPDTEDLPAVAFAGTDMPGAAKAISYRPQFLGQVWIGAAAWPGVYQYIAFDKAKDEGPIFGKFQRMPDEKELNDLQRNGNKRWDLGWVYTVIAGVLNLLVIYDAFAGPMFRDPPSDWVGDEHEEAYTAAPRTPVPAAPPPPPVATVPSFKPPAPPVEAPAPPVPPTAQGGA
ncbi:Uncharacterized protein OS=Blastopirellula marina DSM 3645 GN=DSM3645_01605 PE=4 SV=1 [Gemmata massiliana]|uniref:DUF6677 domain-containing protein n=1 Tax=Gemmata massiliana TaxID=1210884 RepID=A0A6P2CUV2_9BACT|nr:DUF6677 family protein [Gemmata massiliana]VTR90882.1 Uncharacterized protein OS=Blastopirellula marina DSM 3645 GN=DSM3645_01605 PE=4 SV=1 [Gemmata massiliana]